MIRALYTAASGMNAQQANIDNIANNLSNVNTAGFKKSRVEFEDLVYEQARVPGSPTSTTGEAPVGLEYGLGTRPIATPTGEGQRHVQRFRLGLRPARGNPDNGDPRRQDMAGERVVGVGLAFDIVDIWLRTEFSDSPRHHRRVDKIAEVEQAHRR